jgi:hypothetical protein
MYRDERQDPGAREIFWGRIESLRYYLDKVFTTCYYKNMSCQLIVDLFVIVLQLLLREVPLLIDDILTSVLDGLLRTNIRKLHKSISRSHDENNNHHNNNSCPIFLIYQHILTNQTSKLILTSRYLEKYDLHQFYPTNHLTLTEYLNKTNQLLFPPLQSNYQQKNHNYYNRIDLPPISMSGLSTPNPQEGLPSLPSSPCSLSQNPLFYPSKSSNSNISASSSLSSSSSSLPPIRVIVYKQNRQR